LLKNDLLLEAYGGNSLPGTKLPEPC